MPRSPIRRRACRRPKIPCDQMTARPPSTVRASSVTRWCRPATGLSDVSPNGRDPALARLTPSSAGWWTGSLPGWGFPPDTSTPRSRRASVAADLEALPTRDRLAAVVVVVVRCLRVSQASGGGHAGWRGSRSAPVVEWSPSSRPFPLPLPPMTPRTDAPCSGLPRSGPFILHWSSTDPDRPPAHSTQNVEARAGGWHGCF